MYNESVVRHLLFLFLFSKACIYIVYFVRTVLLHVLHYIKIFMFVWIIW